jgi:Glycoside Hydrolase Family 113
VRIGRRAGGALLFSGWLAAGWLAGAPLLAAERATPRQCGVSWVAGRTPVTAADFDPLVRDGVDWIVQTPFGWQSAVDVPHVALVTGHGGFWGERDEGLESTTRLARERGIRTLLKPQIWVRGGEAAWSGEIAMRSSEDWDLWFSEYRAFLLHYARLAERIGASALCVGTELRQTALARPDAWRALIAEVRRSFSGRLTYAANWDREFEEIPFWNQLDFIGIQAYFPLADHDSPSLDELRHGWERHLPAIEAAQRRWGKPVLFTEVGYRSAPDGATRPWLWPQRSPAAAAPVDLRLQADAYQAFFETFWQRSWFAGAYVWKWYPGRAGGSDADFTPQGKPAETVLREWYAGR